MFELLPCPFCGSDAKIKFNERDQGLFIDAKNVTHGRKHIPYALTLSILFEI